MSKEAARYRVMHGIAWLNENVPGWFDRAKGSARLMMMDTFDYDILALACSGTELNGRRVYTSGDVRRVMPGLDATLCGILDDEKNGVTYFDLNTIWREVLMNPEPPRGYIRSSPGPELKSSRTAIESVRRFFRGDAAREKRQIPFAA